MSDRPPFDRPGAETEAAEVLTHNRAFYDAFEALDLVAMESVWASAGTVSCIHPGWAVVVGRDQVLASWAGIFKGTEAIRFQLHDARAFVNAAVAWVVLVEEIEAKQAGQLVRAFTLTTNTFVRQSDGWKMVHHHAAPSPAPSSAKKNAPVLH